jgi:hypothetical protein
MIALRQNTNFGRISRQLDRDLHALRVKMDNGGLEQRAGQPILLRFAQVPGGSARVADRFFECGECTTAIDRCQIGRRRPSPTVWIAHDHCAQEMVDPTERSWIGLRRLATSAWFFPLNARGRREIAPSGGSGARLAKADRCECRRYRAVVFLAPY